MVSAPRKGTSYLNYNRNSKNLPRDEENDTVVNCKAEHPAKNLTITVNDEMENQPPLPQSSLLSNPPRAHDDEEDEETGQVAGIVININTIKSAIIKK